MSALLCYPAYIASSLGRNSIDTHNHHRRRGASLKYINLEMRLYLACAIINQRPPKRSRPRSIRGALTALSRARSSIVVTGFEWFFFSTEPEPSSLSVSEELLIFQQSGSQPVPAPAAVGISHGARTPIFHPTKRVVWSFNFGCLRRAIVITSAVRSEWQGND